MRINDANEWWAAVDKYWAALFAIMTKYLPMDGFEDLQALNLVEPLSVKVVRLKEGRDPKLSSYLNAAWAAAPDSPSIHKNPGWDILCDLCSERDVLYEVNDV